MLCSFNFIEFDVSSTKLSVDEKKIPFRYKFSIDSASEKYVFRLHSFQQYNFDLFSVLKLNHLHFIFCFCSHHRRFIMENHLNDSVCSVGCVICTINFTSKDDTNVVTTCGHLYHKSCLTKWFSSAQE